MSVNTLLNGVSQFKRKRYYTFYWNIS